MNNRRRNVVLAVVSLLLIVSVIFNWYQYKHARSMNNAAYGWGFELALGGVNRADGIFSGQISAEDTIDAARYIAESAGQFQALARTMDDMGVPHTMGIGMRLDEAAQVLAHPNQYSEAQIQHNKEFVHNVAAAFKPCWNAQYLIKSRLPGAIDKIYNAMTPQERQQLYPMY